MNRHRTLIAAAFGLSLACGGSKPAHEAPAAGGAAESQAAPVSVNTAAAERAEWTESYQATGTVRARAATVISSKVMGYVREVKVRLGDRVSAGELLVSLDARDLDTGRRQAEAGLAEARAAQSEVENAIAAANAQLELAEATFRRMQDLHQKKSISTQEFDEAQARLKLARAQHEMAVSKRSQLASRIQQAEHGVQAAGITREYAEIRAPFGGVVTEKQVEPGTLAAPGTPLLTIEQAGAWRLEASVEESRLPVVRVGQPVEVEVEALAKTIGARVSEIVPAVDPASRAFVVKIDLPAMPQLRSGLFGRARFTFGARQVLTIPESAVVVRGQLQSVFVPVEGRARLRMVTLGERRSGQAEVLSGLTAGERVVAPAAAALTDGAKVEARP